MKQLLKLTKTNTDKADKPKSNKFGDSTLDKFVIGFLCLFGFWLAKDSVEDTGERYAEPREIVEYPVVEYQRPVTP